MAVRVAARSAWTATGMSKRDEHAAVERPGRTRVAKNDRDLPGRDSVVEEPGDLGADGLDLGQLPSGGEQRDAAVVLDRLAGLQLPEAALDLEQGRALREARLGLQALDRHSLEVPKLGEERSARLCQ